LSGQHANASQPMLADHWWCALKGTEYARKQCTW